MMTKVTKTSVHYWYENRTPDAKLSNADIYHKDGAIFIVVGNKHIFIPNKKTATSR